MQPVKVEMTQDNYTTLSWLLMLSLSNVAYTFIMC